MLKSKSVVCASTGKNVKVNVVKSSAVIGAMLHMDEKISKGI